MDKRSQTSAENGKKGGRKKGIATLQAEQMRNMIATELATRFMPILSKALDQAEAGDRYARDWVTDTAFGKVPIALSGVNGKDLFPTNDSIEKTKRVILTFLNERPEADIKDSK